MKPLRAYAGLMRNSAFNLGGHAVSVLAALVCIPIAFRELGPERFGLLMLVWGVLSYAIVFDLGTGPAVARATAASLVHDQGRRIAALFRAGALIQLSLGVLAGALLALLAPQLLELLKVPIAYRADAQRALYAVALALPVVLMGQSLQAVLEGVERFDWIAYIRTPIAVATYAVPAVGALAGWSLATMMFGLLIVRIAAGVIFYGLYRKALPAAQSGTARSEIAALFRYARWLAVSGVIAQLLMYLDRFMLSALHGLTAVAQYAAPYDAATKLLLIPGSIGVALFPGLSKDAARAQANDAVARSRAAARMTMIVLLPLCAVLFAFAGPLLHLWLGPQLSGAGVAAFRVLVLATLLHALAYPPVILIEAFGRSDSVARYSIAELIAYLPVATFMIWRFGVAGAAWTWVARSAALMLWSNWYARRWVRTVQPATLTQFANGD